VTDNWHLASNLVRNGVIFPVLLIYYLVLIRKLPNLVGGVNLSKKQKGSFKGDVVRN